ncbi:transposase [Acinetobacter baumannii]|uniref:IS66 family transposase n=1 Tax=Acinetobacter baumannii TaxID=470 RepID=UPI0038CD6860
MCWYRSMPIICHRQRLIYQRAGIDLSRSTLSDWIGRCGVELEPLANALKEVVLQQRVLHADEHRSPSCGWVRIIKNRRKVMSGPMPPHSIIQFRR